MRFFLPVIMVLLPFCVNAQLDDTAFIKEKARALRGIYAPDSDLSTSTFTFFKRAVEFSNRKDSVNASAFILQVDPYYLMFLGQTGKSIDTFLSRYCFTVQARASYRQQFTSVFSQPRPGIYNTLQEMFKETLGLIHQLDSVPGKMKAAAETRVKTADSMHFRALYQYVSQNGWPDMQHGSLFAGAIARRDIMHCYDYLPIMLDAFKMGEISANDLLFVEFNKRYYPDMVTMRGYLKGAYIKYDISSALVGVMPANANDIIADVRKYCPIKNVVELLESPPKLYRKKRIGAHNHIQFEHFEEKWSRFNMELFDACVPWKNARADDDHGVYTYWMPYDRQEERLTLYIIKAQP